MGEAREFTCQNRPPHSLSEPVIDSGVVSNRNFRVAVSGTLVALTMSLTACVAQQVHNSPTPSVSTSGTVTTPTPQASLVPNGSAQQNLPFFNQVNEQTLARNSHAQGRDFLQALVAAGFPKSAMQVTADKTTVNLTPGSIQFSVNIGDYCLIGQNGTASGGYHGEVVPALAGGVCLIGQTAPINW